MADQTPVVQKQLTPAQLERKKINETKRALRIKFGNYLPKGADPISIYRQWKASIFAADPDKVDDQVMLFVLGQAHAAGIDATVPKQIYALPFNTKVKDAYGKDTGEWAVKFNIVIGIEGMVTIAENTGQYGGTTRPEYEFDDKGQIVSCTIGVHKVVQGILVTSEQTVYFDEYNTGKNLWASKPKTMIKKVAHAHALRAAFSATKGLNIVEEIERDDVIDMDANGNITKTNSSADIQKAVKDCKTIEELQQYYDALSYTDKQKAQSFVNERFTELA